MNGQISHILNNMKLLQFVTKSPTRIRFHPSTFQENRTLPHITYWHIGDVSASFDDLTSSVVNLPYPYRTYIHSLTNFFETQETGSFPFNVVPGHNLQNEDNRNKQS